MADEDRVEKQLTRILEEGQPKSEPVEQDAVKHLSPRYEIRIQHEKDPLAEEIKQYRKLAEEIDDRYDSYLSKIPAKNTEDKPE